MKIVNKERAAIQHLTAFPAVRYSVPVTYSLLHCPSRFCHHTTTSSPIPSYTTPFYPPHHRPFSPDTPHVFSFNLSVFRASARSCTSLVSSLVPRVGRCPHNMKLKQERFCQHPGDAHSVTVHGGCLKGLVEWSERQQDERES